ncbi:MAG: redoxin domain-containing protein [Candidatus Zixiibacteriota bacterium]|nr:MAG: redoxin domain-containing protein [candidate division Zixibacteria bacterium]
MQRVIVVFAVLLLLSAPIVAQTESTRAADSVAIKQAVLDFAEGYYSGDVARVEKAIHPDINRCTPRDLPQTGRTAPTYSTYSGLIENTRAKVVALDDNARHIQVQILDIDNDVANTKLISASFVDYHQLIKLDNQWKIVNELSGPGSSLPPRMKDFKPEDERAAIERTALDYQAGLYATDAKRLDLKIDPEISKIVLVPLQQTGKTGLRRQRAEATIENALAQLGKQDEPYRDFSARIIDITDGLAVVRVNAITAYEFLQMYKAGGQWRILNSIARPRTDLTVAQAMTVIAGDPMPDFTLPIYDGGEFTLSKYRGKNVLLMFPRGWLGAVWCPYCPYQYLELEKRMKESDLKAKYNLEVAFVLPYSADRVKDWLEKFPEAMTTVENVKNPQPQPKDGTIQADYAAWARRAFPIKFNVMKDDPHTLIPVLADERRTLSRQLKIFTSFWDGVSSEQNRATVLVIDKKGVLQFKYVGQMTEDRPSIDYLLDFISRLK